MKKAHKLISMILALITLASVNFTHVLASETFGDEPLEQTNENSIIRMHSELEVLPDETASDVYTNDSMMTIDITVDGPITDEMLDYGVPIAVYANGVHIATVNADIPDDDFKAIAPLNTSSLNIWMWPHSYLITHSLNTPTPNRAITYSWNITSTSPSIPGSSVVGSIWHDGWGMFSSRNALSGTLTFTPTVHSFGTWTFRIMNLSDTLTLFRGTATLRQS